MIKIEMVEGHANILFDGDPIRVSVEISAAISGIYQGFQNMRQEDAAMFKRCMQECVVEASPVWEMKHEITQIVIP